MPSSATSSAGIVGSPSAGVSSAVGASGGVSGGPSMASRVGSCTIAPSWVTQLPDTISSAKSGANTPLPASSFAVIRVTRLTTFWA